MITFKEFVSESINDKGLFKAVFVIGLPGAGKSYTTKQLSGTISPMVVNTDRASEFLSKKTNTKISKETWSMFNDSATRITKTTLEGYLNGMLPLFVDGTSNNISNVLHRIGILESLGYDVGVIYIKTDLETAKTRVADRAEKIGREVDSEFIDSVAALIDDNAEFLKSKVSFFKELDNSNTELSNQALQKLYKQVQSFFASPITNPIGVRTFKTLKSTGSKYLSPSVIAQEVLSKKVEGWYKS